MWRLTSSEPEIDSLIAVPRSCRSCLIFSSTRSPSMRVNLLKSITWIYGTQTDYPKRPPSSSIFHSANCRSTLIALARASPQFGPIAEILPAPPLRVMPQHRLVADLAAAVIRLAHVTTKLRVDGDEVVTPIHRQQMRSAVRTDARQLQIAL